MTNLVALFASHRTNLNANGLRHPFDRYSYPLYFIMALAFFFDLVFYISSRFSVTNIFYSQYLILFLWPWISGLIARRYGFPKIGTTLEMLSLITVQGFITLVMIAFLASVSLPFADTELIRMDRVLGFDWLKLFEFYQNKPDFTAISGTIYRTILWQMPFVVLVLVLTGNRKRGWQFLTAWTGAGVFTALIFPFFPAVGPYIYFDLAPEQIPGLMVTWPWEFGTKIEGLRNGSTHIIDLNLTGLVQFPSFHTAAAIMFAWALLPFRYLRWPTILLNTAMIFATLINGGHYLIDLVGGAVIAVVAILIGKKMLDQIRPDGQQFPVVANDPLS